MFKLLRARLAPRLARTLMFVGAAGLALGTAACTSDGPTGLSQQTASFGKTGGDDPGLNPEVSALLWRKTAKARTVSAVIGKAGGELRIPSGARLIVPPGAVSGNVTFRVTQIAGRIMAHDFQPHGTRFAVPLTFEVPTKDTNFGSFTNPLVRGAYFKDAQQLFQDRGTAIADEFRPTFTSVDKKWITFSIDHFSGYMVAMD